MKLFSTKTAALLKDTEERLEHMSAQDPMRKLLSGLAEVTRRYQSLFENALQAMYIVTIEGHLLEANPAFAAMLGYSSVEALLSIKDFARKHYMVPSGAALAAELRKTGAVRNREVHLKHLDGSPIWGLSNIWLFHDAAGREFIEGITVDITARKHAEQALAQSEMLHRRILETAGEGFMFMDNKHVIQEVNEAGCRMIGKAREEILGRVLSDFATPEFSKFLLRHGERLHSVDYRTLEGSFLTANGRVVPVLIHGNILRREDGAPMGTVIFLSDITEQKKALTLAAEVQQGLMPSAPPRRLSGLDVAGRSIPSQYVGGDYFDYLEEREDQSDSLRLVVGDVTGHGLDAALLMTTARGFLRMRSAQPGMLSEIISDLNSHLSHDTQDSGRFMSLLIMDVDPASGLSWVRAGHEPALLYNPADASFQELSGPGMLLGVVQDASYEVSSAPGLLPGQVLAIGTDGIWEAQNDSGEMFGKQRFREVISSRAAEGAEAILEAVFEEVQRFAGPMLKDDITLVVVKIQDGSPST